MNSRHAMIQNAFSIDEKVAFLKQSKTYPHPVHAVQTKETHMSWIFLVDDFVYKLKKPVKYKYIDHRSIESRFKDCKREVRLNEKLAKDIYLDVVPLTSDDGKLQLSGNGLIEDWLVKMKRIPEEAMLDYAIKFNKIDENRLKEASLLLTNFYKQQPFILVTKEVFRKEITKGN